VKKQERLKVLWLGAHFPPVLEDELGIRGLELESVEQKHLDERVGACRGVVLPYDVSKKTFQSSFRNCLRSVLDHGAGIALVPNGKMKAADFQTLTERLVYRYNYQLKQNERKSDRLNVFNDEWEKVAEWMVRGDFDPGPGINPKLRITGDTAKLDDSAEILFKRAFSDYEEIELQILASGKSGADVYVVLPRKHASEKRILPFLAKIGEKEKIDGERARFQEYVADHVPFNHRPNFDFLRYAASGLSKAILVGDFVERAQSLRQVISQDQPENLIASLFAGPLRGWRHSPSIVDKPLFDRLPSLATLHEKPELANSAAYAIKHLGSKHNVAALFAKLKKVRSLRHLSSKAHFDLHSENIFVAPGSSALVLIDFGQTGAGPVAADPACLEVDLAFKVAKGVPEDLLQRLYRYPLKLSQPKESRSKHLWLVRAIYSIRKHGCEAEPDHDTYVFAVARYLLRFAAYADQGTAGSRGLAYALAEQLARSL
jgi:hypothetical protein